MKKKFMSIVLSGLLIVAASSCGVISDSDDINLDNIEEKLEDMSDDKIEELITDTFDDSDEKNIEIVDNKEEKIEITITDEILSADMYAGKIQIASKVYSFPLSVCKLTESGELRVEAVDDDEKTNENTLVNAADSQSFRLVGDRVSLVMTAVNQTDSVTELKNCIVGDGAFAIYVRNYNSIGVNNDNVFLSGGLKIGTPYDELIEKYGEADYVDTKNNIYNYYEKGAVEGHKGRYYIISIDMDNACVGTIAYGNDVAADM